MTTDTHTPSTDPHLSAGAGGQQFLRFAVGRENYTVKIDVIREILQVSQMTPLPLMPDFVRGVMNLRGAVVPVIDLSARLGLGQTTIGRRSCIVMVDIENDDESAHTLGVLVDAVHEVFDVDAEGMDPVPTLGTRINPDFIRCMVKGRGQTTAELDLAKILGKEDLMQLIAQATAH